MAPFEARAKPQGWASLAQVEQSLGRWPVRWHERWWSIGESLARGGAARGRRAANGAVTREQEEQGRWLVGEEVISS